MHLFSGLRTHLNTSPASTQESRKSWPLPFQISHEANCLRCCVLQIIIVGALSIHFTRMNKKAMAGSAVIEGLPGFRYTL